MKTSATQKLLLLLTCSCLSFFNGKAQNIGNEKLTGCWKFVKLEFPEADEDSAEIKASFKGASTCFEANGKFSSRQMVKGKETNVGTGTFSISKDGKTLYQRSNETDAAFLDASAAIIELTESSFKIKVETLILVFEKVKP